MDLSEFEVFKKHLYDGNFNELKNAFMPEFVDKLIDFSSQKRAIHYALSNGHTDIVKFLIDNNCNIESATKTLMRPIHFIAKDGHLELAKLLIGKHCNIESETQYKRRAIHLACGNAHVDIVKLLIDNNCLLECETQNKRRPIHCACVSGSIEIVQLLIEKKCDLESVTQNKWKPIHYACERGFVEIVRLLIENKSDPESESEDNWRPIHCACLNGHTEIVKLLIDSYHCDIHCKTKDGNTPLNIAHKQGHVECMEYLNSVIRDMRKIFDSVKNNDPIAFHELYRYDILTLLEYPTGLSIVDVALQSKADKIIDYLKNKPPEQAESKYITNNRRITKQIATYRTVMECVLYRFVMSEEFGGFYRNISANLVNGPHEFLKTSFVELCSEIGNGMFLREVLIRCLYNEQEWERGKEIALKNSFAEIESDIESRQSLLLSRKKANVPILHTAIYDNNVDMVTYILENRLVDKNVTDPTFGTGLTLAYTLSQSRVIDALLKFDVDVNIPNKYMQTPICICMENQLTKNFEFMADRLRNINVPGHLGFTVLQYAVVCGYPEFCESLMRRKANYLVDVEFSKATSLTGTDVPPIKTVLPLSCKENCLTLCIKVQCTIYQCFLSLMNDSTANICDGVGDSLLHLSAKVMKPDICKILLDMTAHVNKLNKKGNNALTELICYLSDRPKIEINQENLYRTIELLLDFGIDGTKISSNGLNILHLANVFNEEKFIIDVLKKVPRFNLVSKEDVQIAITKQWFDYTELLYPMISKENRSSFSLKAYIFMCLSNNRSKLTKLLFNNASKKLKQSLIEEILFQAAMNNNLEIFESILKTEISHPDLMENGQTLLTNLVKENKDKYSILLIQSKSGKNLINLKNSEDNYPIHLAIETNQWDIVRELVAITDKLNTENCQSKTPMVLLFQKLSESKDDAIIFELKQLVKLLIQSGGSIHLVLSNGHLVIEECSDFEFRSEIEKLSTIGAESSESILDRTVIGDLELQ